MSEKIVIKMPVADCHAVITSEITPEYFGYMDNAAEILTTLVSAFYGYPVKVTVESNLFGED